MAQAAASRGPSPGTFRGASLRRCLPVVLLLVVTGASIFEVLSHHGTWPWVAATAASAAIAATSVGVYRHHDRRYRSLLDRVPVGLYRTAPNGRIADMNPALAHLFGFETPEELLAAPARSVYADPADRDRWITQVNRAQGPVEAELLMRRRDGSPIWVRDRVVPVRDRRGRVAYYEGQLEDVTDAKRHREELEAALRSKIELIGAVSHELRNPLTSIVGYAHLLHRSAPTGLPRVRRDGGCGQAAGGGCGQHRGGPADRSPGRHGDPACGLRPPRPRRGKCAGPWPGSAAATPERSRSRHPPSRP